MHAVPRRHILAAAIVLAFAVAGAACSRSADSSPAAAKGMAAAAEAQAMAADSAASAQGGAAPAAPAPMLARANDAGGEVKGLANHNGSQLAYAHDVRVRMPADALADSLGKVRDACNAQAFGPCDVLGEQLSAGDYPSGELQMRAAPAAIAGLVRTAAAGGEITQRSTQAEDLAEAVRDNGMRRKRLELQHAKLTEILEQRHGNMDELVALTERLAMLEAELAGADQEAAQQQRRIATNLLSLHFEAENVSVATAASTRLGESFRGLTAIWDGILAWMVTALLGVAVPFAIVFGAVGWLALKLFRRRKPAPAAG
jgi:hypothetical protein